MTAGYVIFAPLVPWAVIAFLAVMSVVVLGFGLWRGLSGWAMRGAGVAVMLAALTGPAWQIEDRAPLSDIVIMVEDRSASQALSDRAQQTTDTADALATAITSRPNTELRRVTVADAADDGGSLVIGALTEALAREPKARVAGMVVVSDGQIHDADLAPLAWPAPVHLLQTGHGTDWDRRLIVKNAPAFAIIDEDIMLTLRIEDDGAATTDTRAVAPIEISVDGEPPQTFALPIGRDIELPVTLRHGGRNVIQFFTPAAEGELTDRNNSALVQINGVRDRLRVLLVSGEPHAGSRTWRNLLKSDSSVDLVHFTILRPPEKQDGVPVNELSLIAFPTRELFLEKVHDFDLIIFDRYKRRGILPAIYLDNVASYVEQGGAVLIAAGPDYASAYSLYRSPLDRILPAEPTARVLEQPFVPTVTDIGERHPVTAGMNGDWGRWLRQIEVLPTAGQTVMAGVDGRPLLQLERAGAGRVAFLGSDHAWLWSRGYEGGGPQLDLLRRLAHWMMKEPELEEEALTAEATGQTMQITRRTLNDEIGPVTVTAPDGTQTELNLTEQRPGLYSGRFTGGVIGLYRLSEGDAGSVIGLGPAAPREFERTIATDDAFAPILTASRGGAFAVEDGQPRLRDVRENRPAAGRGWMGLLPRNAFETQGISQTPLLPIWLVLLFSGGLVIGGWLREGRQ